MLERLRDDAPNLAGLKVSDTPWASFERYLLPGFDVFVGPEALIYEGLERGAVGAVSALASAFPADVAGVVHHPTAEGAARLSDLRAFVERFPRQAALKRLLGRQGVPVREDVRAPLRTLTAEEREELDAWHDAAARSYSRATSNSSYDVRLSPISSIARGVGSGELVVEARPAEALGRLVPDPRARRLELRERVPELVDRRLRVEQAPDQDADDQRSPCSEHDTRAGRGRYSPAAARAASRRGRSDPSSTSVSAWTPDCRTREIAVPAAGDVQP